MTARIFSRRAGFESNAPPAQLLDAYSGGRFRGDVYLPGGMVFVHRRGRDRSRPVAARREGLGADAGDPRRTHNCTAVLQKKPGATLSPTCSAMMDSASSRALWRSCWYNVKERDPCIPVPVLFKFKCEKSSSSIFDHQTEKRISLGSTMRYSRTTPCPRRSTFFCFMTSLHEGAQTIRPWDTMLQLDLDLEPDILQQWLYEHRQQLFPVPPVSCWSSTNLNRRHRAAQASSTEQCTPSV